MDEKQSTSLAQFFEKLERDILQAEKERGPFTWCIGSYNEPMNTYHYHPDCGVVNAGLEPVSAVLPLRHFYTKYIYMGVEIWGGHFEEKSWHETNIGTLMLKTMYCEQRYFVEERKWDKILPAAKMYSKALLALYLFRPVMPIILYLTDRYVQKWRSKQT